MERIQRATRVFIRLLAAAGFLALAVASAVAESDSGIVLAAAGKGRTVIVIPEQAVHPVAFAARELQHYLGRMTGAEFPIVHAIPRSGAAIILGAEFARGFGVDPGTLPRDAFVIKTAGEHVFIAGRDDASEKSSLLFMLLDSSQAEAVQKEWHDRQNNFAPEAWDFERGSLFGSYDFLERLGVRWFFPGPKGEIVPFSPDLRVPSLDIREEPFFLLRRNGRILFDVTFSNAKTAPVLDRQEYEDLGWNPQLQQLWLIRNRESPLCMPLNHRPARQQWAQRFAASHPEYFALLADGSRATGGDNPARCYLNYTSEGMLQETLKDMDAFFRGHAAETRGLTSPKNLKNGRGWDADAAYGDYFSLLPNDGLRVDQSPESLRFIREDAPLFFRHTNYIWQFVNRAALELKKTHPDKFITCIAYQSYCEVPDPEVVKKLPDNVIVGIAALSGCSRIHAFMVEKSRLAYVDLLRRWSRMSDAPMVFWTYWLYRHGQADRKGVPMLLPHGAQEFVKTHALFGKYFFMEHDLEHQSMELLNRYVMFRLLWNPHLDMAALLRDYCEKSFGAAAAPMQALLADIEQRCQKNAEDQADVVAIWEKGFSAEVMRQYRLQMEQAKTLAVQTACRERIDLLDRYFLGAMERARTEYGLQVKTARDQGRDRVSAYACPPRAISVDGDWDQAWKVQGGKAFYNNVNGKVCKPVAYHRIRYSDQALYFFFDIPALAETPLAARQNKEYLEVFLDVNQNRETYFWLQILPDGSSVGKYFPGPGEPPLDWKSASVVATSIQDDGWRAEVAIPLSSLGLEGKELDGMQLGALFGLTRLERKEDPDRFASSNPILRGAFHQPGMFNRMDFVKHAESRAK